LYTLAYNAWDRPRRGDDYVRLLQNYCDAANSDNELATVARLNNEIRKAGGNPVAANAQAGRQGFIKRMFNRDQKSSWGAPWRR